MRMSGPQEKSVALSLNKSLMLSNIHCRSLSAHYHYNKAQESMLLINEILHVNEPCSCTV